MFSSNYCFLICIQVSREASKVVWYTQLFKNFTQFVVIHTIKGFSVVNEAKEFQKNIYFCFDCFDFESQLIVENS